MANHKKIQSDEEMIRWVRSGMQYKKIAELHTEKYGIAITQYTVSGFVRTHGLSNKLQIDLPWPVNPAHSHDWEARCIRSFIRMDANLPSKEVQFKALLSWLKNLDVNNWVIKYDWDEGFKYVDRERGMNPHVPYVE